MRRATLAAALVSALSSAAGAARAGPYIDQFSTCAASKLGDADRTILITWLFEEMSAHPTLKPLANVTDEQRTEATKAVAALVQRLVTEDCRSQAAAALRNEGGGVLMGAFWSLGQDSLRSLARDPAVSGNMAKIGQYVDTAKFAAIMRDPAPEPK